MAKSSMYKGVTKRKKKSSGDNRIWQAHLLLEDGKNWNSYHEEERAAAIAYDRKLLELGKPPVNILKPNKS